MSKSILSTLSKYYYGFEGNQNKKVNQKSWDIEGSIRIKEIEKSFDDNFFRLVKVVYLENERNNLIKQKNQ